MMTASVLKQNPHTWKYKKNAYLIGHNMHLFRVSPFVKQQNKHLTLITVELWNWNVSYLSACGSGVSVSNVLKNVGMTMTCVTVMPTFSHTLDTKSPQPQADKCCCCLTKGLTPNMSHSWPDRILWHLWWDWTVETMSNVTAGLTLTCDLVPRAMWACSYHAWYQRWLCNTGELVHWQFCVQPVL